MLNINYLFFMVYNILQRNIPSFNTTATVNGTPINMSASYQPGIITLLGSVTIQSQTNSLLVEIYFGNTLMDSFSTQVQISPGTYTVVYTLNIQDDTGIIDNAIGYVVTKQLSNVSISTNASSYSITLTRDMLTFYLEYSSYPSTVSITVTFSLSNGSSVKGSFQTSLSPLPQGVQVYYIVIPVTFY